MLIHEAELKEIKIQEEDERQRLRVRVAHHLLVVLYLLKINNISSISTKPISHVSNNKNDDTTESINQINNLAHFHLRSALDECNNNIPDEMKESLLFFHSVLSKFVVS